ncbi:MAG: hypothetical protein CMB80_20850 [Flammeovirgaceae bacterium]|nr:hypothetical protein [Flammeovirgaceae bacterium]MBE63007.1 hypothetical protein [Flammeovirgaceae bacterium]
MIRTRLFTFFLLQVFYFAYGYSIDLSKVNLAFQYDQDAGIEFSYRVVDKEDSVQIIYSVATDTINNWNQAFLIQDQYNSVAHDTLRSFVLDTLIIDADIRYFNLTLAKQEKSLLLIVWYDQNRGVFRVSDVRIKSPVGFPNFYPTDEAGYPILTNYVTTESIQFQGGDQFHSYKYRDDFGPADPAMGRMNVIAPSLAIDSSFFFEEAINELDPYHFYLVQKDTLDQNAITLLSCPSYFPAQRRIEELVPPLTYITTETELKTLAGRMSKGAFENFWVNTYGSRFRAKSAIRNFYQRVETVNKLFTDYKQGWKTDRGVIYLIFGRPDKVYRSERSEVWQYISGEEFEFIRISTLFTPSMYTLKRDRSYEQVWYDQVGELRKGM